MTDLDVLMIEAEEHIRKKINVGEDQVHSIATVAGLEHAKTFIRTLLKELFPEFIIARGREYLLNNPPGPEVILDAWAEAFFSDEQLLKRTDGRPAYDALLHLYYMIGNRWNIAPPVLKDQRRAVKWGPKFYLEQDGCTEPQNLMGAFFVAVVNCFDDDYTAANCSAVVSRVKDLSRSRESVESRQLNSRARVRKHRQLHKKRLPR